MNLLAHLSFASFDRLTRWVSAATHPIARLGGRLASLLVVAGDGPAAF